MLRDEVPEVRTAAVRTFGTLLGLENRDEKVTRAKMMAGNWILSLAYDGCTAVRREVVAALSVLLAHNEELFLSAVSRVQLDDERRRKKQHSEAPRTA